MKKWLIALVFCVASMAAHAACDPVSAVPGMIGCWPTVTTMGAGDFVDIWQPGPFPASANKITKANLFAAPGPIGSGTASTGAFTTLAATGTLTVGGVFTNNANISWGTDSWPGTNKLGIYSSRVYTGSPTGSFSGDILGNSLPLNLLHSSTDQLVRASGIVSMLEIAQNFGGGATAGGRGALIVNQTLVGAQAATPYPFNTVATFAQGIGANITGAAGGSGNGIGAYYLYNGYYGRIFNNSHVHELDYAEIDFGAPGGTMVGSTTDYVYGLKFVLQAPNTWGNSGHAYLYESLLNFGTLDPASSYLMNHIIVFGDPQNPAGGFPGSPTGDLITSFPGTTGTAIDFSSLTMTNLIKGSNGFVVKGNNHISSDEIDSVTGNSFCICTPGGNPMAVVFASGGSPASYPAFGAGAQASVDVGGTGAPLWLGVATATEVDIGKVGILTKLIGNVSFTVAGGTLGFYGASPIVKATPVGACAGNTGCQVLRDALGNLGLINTGSITN